MRPHALPLGASSPYPLPSPILIFPCRYFSMLVLKSSLGQVDGEHTGHSHEPCHTSIDEFCCDTRPWEEGKHRVKEGSWLQRAAHSKDWMGKCREKGRRAGMEQSKGRNGSSGDLSPTGVQRLLSLASYQPQQPLWLTWCASLPRSNARDRLGARSQDGLATSFRGIVLSRAEAFCPNPSRERS